MAVIIRLTRAGRRHMPFYHIGIFNSRTRRDGRPIEQIGFYAPEDKTEKIRLDAERAKHWLSVGAQPTETVISILKEQGLTSDLWVKARKKPSKPKARTALKRAEAKKARNVKPRKKGRTANSKKRAEAKKA